jgi:uncharacterized repeat protein (TIGR01451 family)
MKYIVVLLFFLLLAYPSKAHAAQAPNCEQIYNGGPSCEQNDPILINKTVQNPQTKDYVDNLKEADTHYSSGQTVLFKLTITNTSDTAVANIIVNDTFPPYIDLSKGSGKYDATTKTYTFTIDQLQKKETKVYFIEGKVVSQDKLPADQSSRCVINQASVTANNKTSQDNALICLDKTATSTPSPSNGTVTKGGLIIHKPSTTKTTPSTGPEALAIIGLAPLGALGYILRKRTLSEAKT